MKTMGFERIRVLRHLFGGSTDTSYAAMEGKASNWQSEAELRSILHALQEHEMADYPLDALSMAVIDTETTGFYPNQDHLLSIGAVQLDVPNGQEHPTFHTYVKLPKDYLIPDVVTDLTGITEETVKDAPDLGSALQSFLQFVGDRILVAHHAAHDIRFLNVGLRKSWGVELDHHILDTGKIAMILHDFKKYPSLDVLLSLYGVVTSDRHTALGDAMMTAKIMTTQVALLQEKGLTKLGHLWEWLVVLEHERKL